jgi:hypothetical protein
MKRTSLILVSVAALTLAIGMPAQGQTTGRLRGTVVDLDGLSVPGVTVTIRSEVLMGGERMAVTGDTGAYSFTALPPGTYNAEAALVGFTSSSHEGVRVVMNATATVNFILAPVEFTEEMTVTGEAPLVDVSSSGMSTSLGSRFLQDLPTDRTMTDTFMMTPGVTFAQESNPFHLNALGSDAQSNNWNVDGIEVSSPGTGSAWIEINPAIIEETQVLGVGAPAEFGNLQGAVLNLVTKSGSNQLKGTFDLYWFDNALLDSDVGFEESEFSEFEQVHPSRNLSVSLGGAVVRDRLWYFAAYEDRQDGLANPGQDPANTGPTASDGFDLKLSGRISDRHLLELRGGAQAYSWLSPSSEFREPSSAIEQTGDPTYWTASYQSIFSDRSYLEARFSGWRDELENRSQTGSTEPAYIDFAPPDGGPPRYSGGTFWPILWPQSTDQLDVAVSHFADDFLHGDHDFKFGIQAGRGEESLRISPSVTGSYYFHTYYGYLKIDGRPYYYGSEQETWGVFVDDSWDLSDRLTLNLGLRFDHAEGSIPAYPVLNPDGSPSGEEAFSLDPAFSWDNWSPRVGFAYNLGADRRTVVRGAFGIYYDGVVGLLFSNPPPYTPTRFYSTGPSWEGPWDFVGVWSFESLTANVDPELRSPHTLQYSLGVEREFSSVYSVGATLLYKDSRDAIGWEILDDGVYETFPWTDPFNGRTYELLNPVEFPTIRKGNSPGFTVEGPLGRYRSEYRGLILTFNRRFADWWGLQASYAYSSVEGLNPAHLQFWQYGGVGLGKRGSHPNQWLNTRGGQPLPNDRPHMFRAQANWQLPWNLHASTVLRLQSGRPYTRQARVPYNSIGFEQTNFIAARAGDAGRFDFQNLIDFAIGKRWRLPGRVILKTDLQFFNLLNSTAVDDFQTYVLNEGDDYVPRTWVKPRRLMLRIGLEY